MALLDCFTLTSVKKVSFIIFVLAEKFVMPYGE